MLSILTIGINEEDKRPNIEVEEDVLEACGVTLEEFEEKLDLELVGKLYDNIVDILVKEDK